MSGAQVQHLVEHLLTNAGDRARIGEMFLPLDKAHDQLRPFQKNGIRFILQGSNLFVTERTGAGKTIIGLVCLWTALTNKRIGVYLVPHTRLLAQKAGQIRAFFGEAAHVEVLQGESRPPVGELRKMTQRLILVATYEAFRSFLFDVERRQYFTSRKVFGGIVVDEAHHIGDPRRGPALESLLYKLRDEHPVQFCFLSASFSRKSAGAWADRFAAKLIWEDPNRVFRFEVRDKTSTSGENETSALDEVLEGIFRDCKAHAEDPIETARVLIFCRSRDGTEYEATRIVRRFRQDLEERKVDLFCRHIHAGLDREDQDQIFHEFETHQEISIACCTSLLETGIDVPEIKRVIIKDAERYTAVQLAQMLGRSREDIPQVLFLVSPGQEEVLRNKLNIDEGDPHLANGVKLEPITSRIDFSHVRKFILERLHRSQVSRGKLLEHFEKLLEPNLHEEFAENLPFFIKEAFKNEFVRRSGKGSGMLGLTYLGEALVESQLDVESGTEITSFFKEHSTLSGRQLQELLARLVTQLSYDRVQEEAEDENLRAWREKRKNNMMEYLKRYKTSRARNLVLQKKLNVPAGDAETYRKQSIWLACALYLLYRGLKLHEMAEHSKLPYFQVSAKLNQLISKEKKSFRCLQRVIRRFQKDKREAPWAKPQLRPRRARPKKSRYRAVIYFILVCKKEQGATVKELIQEIKKFEGKRGAKKLPPPTEESVRVQLRGKLAPFVRRRPVNLPQPGRAHHRYFLKEYYKPWADRCKECIYFKERKSEKGRRTFCHRTGETRSGLAVACQQFHRRKVNFLIFREFEVSEQGVKCPRCGRFGTVTIPQFGEMTVCKACTVVLKRVRQGRFGAKFDVDIPADRIEVRDGMLVVPIEVRNRIIFLEKGELLTAVPHDATGVHLIKITGTQKYTYFLDEVQVVIDAGGTIPKPSSRFLGEHGVPISVLSKARIKITQESEKESSKLRSALGELAGEDALLALGRKIVFAKIKSNICHTHDLNRLRANFFAPGQADELILQQFDYVIASYLSPVTPGHLLSQEGNAEIPAWLAQKLALPEKFRFKGRQAQRVNRSDLYLGAKAHDPYNAALNYLYHQLEENAMGALSRAGFQRYYPGPGLLHSRHKVQKQRNKSRSVKTSKNRELIFDFMDAYRPPFRHQLGAAFRQGRITRKDFVRTQDEWRQPLYIPTDSCKRALDQLYKKVFFSHFYHDGESKQLRTIMNEEARMLARFVDNRDPEVYVPFSAFKSQEEADAINYIFRVFENILGEIPRIKLAGWELPKRIPKVPAVSAEPLPKNVIIVTHADPDGFGSALFLTLRHLHEKNLTILFASGKTESSRSLNYVLDQQLYKYLLSRADNVLYIADFQVLPENEAFYKRLFNRLKDRVLRLQVTWFDHHDPTVRSKEFMKALGVQVVHDGTRVHAYQVIREFLRRNIGDVEFLLKFFVHGILKLLGLARAANERGKTRSLKRLKRRLEPYRLFHKLRPYPKLELVSDPKFIYKWQESFELHLRQRDYYWAHFFRRLCHGKTPRQTKRIQRAREEDLTAALSFHSFFPIVDLRGTLKFFALLVFKKEFSMSNVSALLECLPRPGPLKRLLPPTEQPDFVACYWSDHTITLKALSPSVNFSGIVQNPERGFSGRTRIFYPMWKVFRFEIPGDGASGAYSFLPINEFAKELTRRELKGAPEPLEAPEVRDLRPSESSPTESSEGEELKIPEEKLKVPRELLIAISKELEETRRDPSERGTERKRLRSRFEQLAMDDKVDDLDLLLENIIAARDKEELTRGNEEILIYLIRTQVKFKLFRDLLKKKKEMEEEERTNEEDIFKQDVFPTLLENLDENFGGGIPLGKVYLLYSSENDKFDLFRFLHYLLLIAQAKKGLNSPKVLYIDATPPNFRSLINLAATRRDFTLENIRNILYLKFEKLDQLNNLVTKMLVPAIQETSAQLVVVNTLFDRDLYWMRDEQDQRMRITRRSQMTSFLVRELSQIAKKMQCCIIVTYLEPYSKNVEAKSPGIPEDSRSKVEWKVALERGGPQTQRVGRGRKREVRVKLSFRGANLPDIDQEVVLPSRKRTIRSLKHFSTLRLRDR